MKWNINNYWPGNSISIDRSLRRTLVLFILCAAITTAITSCKSKSIIAADPNLYYTCSMDPQVVEYKPGKCPICHMQLTEAHKSSTGTDADEILLSAQQIQLGNIQTDTIRNGIIDNEVVLTGTLNFNEQQTASISSRVEGRIEKLYYKNMGDYVKNDSPLFEVYSEDLNNAKQEYILALDKQKNLDSSLIDFKQLIESAKNKLLLWGMNDSQINELAETRKASPSTTFYSNAAGYITEMDIKEGDYIMAGATIVKLADLSSLWAEAQVYASQLSAIDSKNIAIVQLPDFAGKEITGKIEFVNPEINPDTRINLIRVSIPNPGNRLKPGMPAYVILKGTQQKVLSLPADAVIRDSKGASVWVRTGSHSFKNKMVTIGMEGSSRIEITFGLQEGDVVVTNGAYLLNSEYIFKKGANPMEGMKM